MGKEYEKVRQECAKKYNEQIKSLEAKVRELEAINKAQAEDLKKQVKLQRDFVKLCIFLNVSENDRKTIIASNELNNAFQELEKVFGRSILSPNFIDSLGKLAGSSCRDTDSVQNIISDLLIKS
jgi:hypothetical protein